MSNNSAPTSVAEAKNQSQKERLTQRFPLWMWIVIICGGIMLTLLGLAQTFTTVSCEPAGTTIVNGKTVPIVPMCIGFLGYDYLADIVGVGLALLGAIRIVRIVSSRKWSQEVT